MANANQKSTTDKRRKARLSKSGLKQKRRLIVESASHRDREAKTDIRLKVALV